jgi:hypothetical protein
MWPSAIKTLRSTIIRDVKHAVGGVWPVQYDVVVVSFGGSGTTFLLKYLATHLKVNSSDSSADGIKHASSPHHPIFRRYRVGRVVYVFDDPRLAAISLFRRDYASHMIPKLNAWHASPKSYKQYIDAHRSSVTFDEFLERQEDLFGFEKHFRRWLGDDAVPFPVMGVRFSSLHDNLRPLLDFLHLPAALAETFPPRRERAASLEFLSGTQRERIEALYGELAREIREMPPVVYRGQAD